MSLPIDRMASDKLSSNSLWEELLHWRSSPVFLIVTSNLYLTLLKVAHLKIHFFSQEI